MRSGRSVTSSRCELPMAVRLTEADPRVDAARGCVAIERGPLVYCVEAADNPGLGLDDLVLDAGRVSTGRVIGDGQVGRVVTRPSAGAASGPRVEQLLVAVPVRGEQRQPCGRGRVADPADRGARTSPGATANRGAMRVWIPADT